MTMRKPSWLRAKLPSSPAYQEVKETVDKHALHTVCQSAQCPNMGECWSRGTATVMILGNVCTRACNFCAVLTGRPTEYDIGEPARVADAVTKMALKHVVVTSVTRDDLKDGGASVWAATIRAIRHRNPQTAIEVLIPDFRRKESYLDVVLDAEPDILNHNVETVPSLQRKVRRTATWQQSVWVLQHAKARDFVTKTSLMLGCGETTEEIKEALQRLRDEAQVDILTLGQYLQPTPKHMAIDRWVTPEEFAELKEYALSIGFGAVESAPLVRSSYRADEQSAKFGLRRHQVASVASA